MRGGVLPPDISENTLNREPVTYVAMDTSQREVVDGQDLIARWLRGTRPRSSYFLPPRGKRALAAREVNGTSPRRPGLSAVWRSLITSNTPERESGCPLGDR